MRSAVAISVVAILVVAAVALGYFAVSTPTSTTTSESTTRSSGVQSTARHSESSLTPLSAKNSSGDGLELTATLNPPSPTAGQNISITVSLFNSLSSPLNVLTADALVQGLILPPWVVNGFPVAMWGGCDGLEPVEFMIVRGNYSVAQLSSASANSSVYESAGISPFQCAEGGLIGSIEFRPDSSMANATCTGMCAASQLLNLTSTFTVSGYWAYPINSSEAADVATPPHPECMSSGIPDCTGFQYPEVGPFAQHIFISGPYTLAVADEWGQAVVLHFAVGAATTSIITSSASGLPPGCAFVKTVTVGGVTMDIYLSEDPALGSTVCVYDHIQGTPPVFTEGIAFIITNPTSSVFFQGQCVRIDGETGSCSTSWDTSQTYKGATPAGGSYRLLISFGGEVMDTGISFILNA